MLPGLPFYSWEVQGKPITIQLGFDVIDRMSPDILRGLGALKRRGAEVGGILLGRTEAGSPWKVIVEDFEPVPTEYLTGPSYNLSENDLVGFEAALARWRSDPAGKLSVVGFYRSHTRDDLHMDNADLALASRYFSDPRNVFLLVRPFASRPSIAGFFFWEDGEISRESTYLQFPFDRRELGGGEPRAVPAARKPQAEDTPLPTSTPVAEKAPASVAPAEEYGCQPNSPGLSILSQPEPRESRSVGLRWLVVPGFLITAGLVGFFAYQNLYSNKAPVTQAAVESALPLKLSVAEKGNQLDVTWDRNAPSITHANRGVLSISDGANKRELELSGTQLRNGRVLYSRLSADVNLRLEVFPEGRESVSESIRIVSTEAPPQPPDTQAVTNKKPPAEPPVEEAAEDKPATLAKKTKAARTAAKPTGAKTVSEAPPKEPAAQPDPQPEVELKRPARRR